MAPVVMLPGSMPSCSRRSPHEATLSTKPPNPVLGVVSGKSGQIDAGNGLEQPSGLVGFFDRSATGQGLAFFQLPKCWLTADVAQSRSSSIPGFLGISCTRLFTLVRSWAKWNSPTISEFWQGSSFHVLLPCSLSGILPR